MVGDTVALGLGVATWARRELPLFFQSYLVLCGVLFNFIVLLLLIWS